MLSPLRQKRLFQELTIYDLERRTGLNAAKISLIERGYRNPRNEEKLKLAKVLNCEVEDIFPDNGGGGNE
ncbi:MAG: helix-turn-helix transcriptional regulator [Desulfobacterales bacterium]|nr:helix-turn-helix transcriptional regulator [Pseudomonadota bacterium]MCG2776974.1 helix-turn-helix transcriptional regulator [Desulfobacterales bacterium]